MQQFRFRSAGYVVGLPSLRLRGDYLAIVTLGFGEILRVVLQQTNDVIKNADALRSATMSELFPPPVGGACSPACGSSPADASSPTRVARDERLLRSIPDIGPVTAVTLLAWLSELGRTDRRAIASLGGVAPRARDSGRYRGRRFLGDGRGQVRRARLTWRR